MACGALSTTVSTGSSLATAPKNKAPYSVKLAPVSVWEVSTTWNKVLMRRTNNTHANINPTCSATVKSNTTVSKNVPSISTR